MRYRLTLLEQMRVVRDDGTEIGHLMDLRTRISLGPVRRSETASVDALLVGAGGWLERIGFKEGGSRMQPNAVVAVERDRVIVRAQRASAPRKGFGKR